MANTDLDDVTSAIQTFWSPLFQDELRQTNLLYNLVNREYTGDLRVMGDTVKVNQINAPTGQRLTIDGAGVGRTFTPEAMTLSTVSITANQRLVASYDIHDLVMIQSMIDPMSTTSVQARAAMVQAISNQLNTYLYTLVAPAAGNTIASTTTMTAATVAAARERAAIKKWSYDKPWFGLLAPQYYSDLLVDTTLTSADFGANNDLPVINGQFGLKRFGFALYEDNTQTAGAAAGGLFFHPDFIYMVSQYEPRFKISDKHSQHEFAYVMSVDWVIGAILGIDGDDKHVKVQTGS